MQEKKRNIIIQEICHQTYFNNNQLIIPIQEQKPMTTCIEIVQRRLIKSISRIRGASQNTIEQLKNTQQNLQYPIQPQTQIQRKDVPNQVDQDFQAINPYAQQKEVNFKPQVNQLITQEQRKYKDDVKIYYNQLNYKQYQPLKGNIDQNQQQKQQFQKTTVQQTQIQTEQYKAQQQQKQFTYTQVVEQNQQQLNLGDSNLKSPNKKHIKIQQHNQELHQIRIVNEERDQFLKHFMTQIKNTLQNYGGIQIVKQSSEERKRGNKSSREAGQQTQFNRNQGQQNQPYQEVQQPKKPKIVEIQSNIQLQNSILRKDQNERLLFTQQQQFYQQQFQQNSPQQKSKQRIQIKEVKIQEPKHNEDIQPDRKQPNAQKGYYDSKSHNHIKNTQQKVQHQQVNRRDHQYINQTQVQIQQQNYQNDGRHRALSDLQQRRRIEYRPGMVITDDLVNQMTPEEIYEYFTQLDLENQLGLKSKIIVLENKRVQINTADSCAICLEDIQPQKEAVDIKLDCNHQFHYVCIKQWLQKSKFCPVCKKQVDCGTNQNIQ
ncbi:unnamed protein product (macronuclear) [Paramecium tetraurelia]|uniref:RING-type domain-containing protein n=1 Tax=Paramecium tetraurelia TaxID=5888 RepID=A0CYF2_PARTE|nr:uncharacterized protein GSPATT00011419001 [Paramecium tetraurelia]CAK75819.1 unnamed protein product [Paramecium tetraurelia]|eukprot:XP_001443216.1 hypothetical protein (macronuclear) [Paramecium tetraurelia strain d4-2]